MASERNLLENTGNEVTVSFICSDRSTGPPHSFSSMTADTKIRVAMEYKHLGHVLYSFRTRILRASYMPSCELAVEDSQIDVMACLLSGSSPRELEPDTDKHCSVQRIQGGKLTGEGGFS